MTNGNGRGGFKDILIVHFEEFGNHFVLTGRDRASTIVPRRSRMNTKLSVTLKQASEVSGLSIRKLYDLIAEGKLKSVRVGRRRLVLYRSLEELIAQGA